MPRCRVAVLGLSGQCQSSSEDTEGVGKSSLCSRFVRPGADFHKQHGEDHQSVVSLADFEDNELKGDHFLYFGAAKRDYLPTGAHGMVPLTIDVVEHTEFVDDACYRPLGTNVKPYHERTTAAKLFSPGKVSYRCHSDIGDRKEEREEFPVEFSTKGVDGYIFVLDPTSSSEIKLQQMKLLDTCLTRFPKNKPVVVTLTKCDQLSSLTSEHMSATDFDVVKFFTASAQASKKETFPGKRSRVNSMDIRCVPGKMELKRSKMFVPYFFASARDKVGVDAPFLYLAHLTLGLPGSPRRPTDYTKLLAEHAKLEARLLVNTKGLMKKCVLDEQTTWAKKQWSLRVHTDFQKFEEVSGESVAKELFCARIVELGVKKLREKDPTPVNQTLQTMGDQRRQKGRSNPYSREGEYGDLMMQKAALERLLRFHPDLKAFSKK